MNEPHQKLFIRRSEAREILGVSDEVFTALVGQSLMPVYLNQSCGCQRSKVRGQKSKARCVRCGGKGKVKGRAFFKRAEVEALAGKQN